MHAPPDYRCPFCAIVQELEADYVYTSQAEVVLRDEQVTAFISAHQWPANRGHVVVVPNEHYENLYELPDALAAPIQSAARRIALALKSEYDCDGISTRQHNEPAGNQDVWHYICRPPVPEFLLLTEVARTSQASAAGPGARCYRDAHDPRSRHPQHGA